MTRAGEALAFSDDVFAGFERAADGAGTAEHTIRFARGSARLRFASPELERRWWPAFAPSALREHAGRGADLVVSCWDHASTGIAPPPSPWTLDDYLPRGQIRGQIEDRMCVTFDAGMRMLTVYDRDTCAAAVHVMDPADVPIWCDRAPFRTVVRWWADDHAIVPLHASAMATDDGAIVVSGPSGSGKSTTALACLAAGWHFIADDLCLVDLEDEPCVHPVYGLAKLEPDALGRVPSLSAQVVDPDADQLVVRLTSSMATEAPVRALLLARVGTGSTTSIEPCDRRDALRALVPGSVLETVGAGPRTLTNLTALLRRVRCESLELGDDIDGVVAMLRTIVSDRP